MWQLTTLGESKSHLGIKNAISVAHTDKRFTLKGVMWILIGQKWLNTIWGTVKVDVCMKRWYKSRSSLLFIKQNISHFFKKKCGFDSIHKTWSAKVKWNSWDGYEVPLIAHRHHSNQQPHHHQISLYLKYSKIMLSILIWSSHLFSYQRAYTSPWYRLL